MNNVSNVVEINVSKQSAKERNSFWQTNNTSPPHTTTVLRSFFRDHPGETVPEKNFWTLWYKGRLTEADTLTIRLGATPSRLSSAHLHHPPFLHAGCPSCRPTNSVKVLKATSANNSPLLFCSSLSEVSSFARCRCRQLCESRRKGMEQQVAG